MPVAMELSRILIREDSDLQLIELTEVGGDRTFPISIGLPEAIAIDRRLKGMPVPRPQTHELLASVIRALGGVLYLTGALIMVYNLIMTVRNGKVVRLDVADTTLDLVIYMHERGWVFPQNIRPEPIVRGIERPFAVEPVSLRS